MNNGLLLIAHGTKNGDANVAVSGYMNTVCEKYREKFLFSGWCFLESLPGIPETILKMGEAGIENCLVIPLFIAPSNHLCNDIPYQIQNSGSPVKFEIARPYMYSHHLRNSLLEQLEILSEYPAEEGIVLFAHGSAKFQSEWNAMMSGIGEYLLKNSGIQVFNFAFIKNGKLFTEVGRELITQEMQSVNKLIILGLYFGKSMLEIYYKYKAELPKYFDSYRNDGRLSFSKYSLLDGDYASSWISDTVNQYCSEGNLTVRSGHD